MANSSMLSDLNQGVGAGPSPGVYKTRASCDRGIVQVTLLKRRAKRMEGGDCGNASRDPASKAEWRHRSWGRLGLGCGIIQREDSSARGHREWKLDDGGKFERVSTLFDLNRTCTEGPRFQPLLLALAFAGRYTEFGQEQECGYYVTSPWYRTAYLDTTHQCGTTYFFLPSVGHLVRACTVSSPSS